MTLKKAETLFMSIIPPIGDGTVNIITNAQSLVVDEVIRSLSYLMLENLSELTLNTSPYTTFEKGTELERFSLQRRVYL